MDKIELRVERVAGVPVDRMWSAVFGIAGGTIGRSGQNKLVLSDQEGGVARVHAMVRLESESAFIANLCERRSLFVGGQEVRSGQEVMLHPGAEIQIGPYALRVMGGHADTQAVSLVSAPPMAAPSPIPTPPSAAVPTPPSVAVKRPAADVEIPVTVDLGESKPPYQAAPAFQPQERIAVQARDLAPAKAPAPKPVPSPAPAQPAAPVIPATVEPVALASTNPWSEAPPTSGADPLGLSAAVANDDNPFAFLGRVGGDAAPVAGAMPAAVPAAAVPTPATVTARPAPPAAPSLPPDPLLAPATGPAAHLPYNVLEAPAVVPAANAGPLIPGPIDADLPNIFAGAGIPAPLATPKADRALVIPDDFDPFAEKLAKNRLPDDPWDGTGLQATSLKEVANLRNEDLLDALPPAGKFEADMDNPAHSGLPKSLDPSVELDPMRLFAGDGGAAGFLNASVAVAPEHGSNLAQVFNLPRGGTDAPPPVAAAPAAAIPPASGALDVGLAGISLQAVPVAAVAAAQVPAAAPVAAAVPAQAGRAPQDSPAPQAAQAAQVALDAGLQPMQGLDLAMFGEGAAAPPDSSNPFAFLGDASASAPAGEIPVAHPAAPSAASAPLLPDDIFAAPPVAPAVPPAAPAMPPAAPPPRVAASAPRQAAAPAVPARGPDPAASSADLAATLQALADAFLEGAGIPKGRATLQVTPEFMKSFGEAFRTAVQGTIDLLGARSEIKREFRADVTIIASGANNPLKFLPSADGVIMQMVGQNFPGFMRPVAAMDEAYRDLRTHQLALMAGMRAAYSEALARFDPAQLEQTVAPPAGLFGKLSAAGHKAALWDEYKRCYGENRQHAEDDLTAFSGQTFVAAYEAAAAQARADS